MAFRVSTRIESASGVRTLRSKAQDVNGVHAVKVAHKAATKAGDSVSSKIKQA